MTPPEIYIDTSVIGGYFDDEFEAETRRLWTLRKRSVYRFKTSSENAFNGVNLLHGHGQVRIVSPSSLIHGHEKDI